MKPQTPSLGRTVKGLPRYFMDCGWWRHPRFVGLSTDALFTFQAIVSYSTEHATDGQIPGDPEDLGIALGMRQGSLGDAIPALIERGVLAAKGPKKDGHPQAYEVRNWAAHNPTAEEVEAYNQAKSRKGTLGNHKRWHEARGVSDAECEWCQNPPAIPEGIPQRSHGESHGMGWDGNPPYPPSARDQETPPTVPGRGLPGGGRDLTETQIVDMAIDIMATCDLARAQADGTVIRNPDRWKAKAAESRRTTHGTDLARIVGEQPDIDPATLAEQLDPTTGPLDGGTARAAAKADADMADLAATQAEVAATKRRRKAADAHIDAMDPDQRTELEQLARASLDATGASSSPVLVRNAMRSLVANQITEETP